MGYYFFFPCSIYSQEEVCGGHGDAVKIKTVSDDDPLGPMFKRARLELNQAEAKDVTDLGDLMDCLAEDDRESLSLGKCLQELRFLFTPALESSSPKPIIPELMYS